MAGLWLSAILTQPAIDVLDIDNGVIDELSHGNRDAAEGHDIDGQFSSRDSADELENQNGQGQRQRNGGERNEGGAKVEQEQKQNRQDEERPERQCFRDVGNAAVDERALLKDV